MAEHSGRIPQRWEGLDPRTIEFIARINEPERENFIRLGDFSDKEMENLQTLCSLEPAKVARLQRFLDLDNDRWEAGFAIVTRSVNIAKFSKKFSGLVVALAAFLLATSHIYGYIKPWIEGFFPGGKP